MENVILIDGVEYVPRRTAYWVIVQAMKPTSVTLHRCSACRTTSYASMLPPYCSECGAEIIGKVKEENDVYILQSP